MSAEMQRSPERKCGAKSPSKPPSPAKQPHDVLHVDIIPSRLFITPEIEQSLRRIATIFANYIKEKNPCTRIAVTYPQYYDKSDKLSSVQVYKNPHIYGCYPKFNVHDDYGPKSGQMSAYAQSWNSIHKIFSQFLTFRSCIASIQSLPVGFCPNEDQKFVENLSYTKPSTYPYDLRLAIPTLQADVGYLIATPPSLSWSLSVALEFFRLQALDGSERGCDTSNLTTDTVGVLENWIDFMLYGSLVESEDERTNYLTEDWIRTTSKSSAQSNAAFPAVMTLIFDCSDFAISPEEQCEDEQLMKLDEAWQQAVETSIQQQAARGTAVISAKQLADEVALKKVFDDVDALCHKRFDASKLYRVQREPAAIQQAKVAAATNA